MREHVGVARKPSNGVVGRRERYDAIERNHSMTRTEPEEPQKLAGTRTEPPVSVPSAKSTSPAATATADPLEEPPGSRSGQIGLIKERIVNVAAFETEGKFVGHCLADSAAPAASAFSTTGAETRRWRLVGKPVRDCRRRCAARNIDQIFDRECASIERAASGRFLPAQTMPQRTRRNRVRS